MNKEKVKSAVFQTLTRFSQQGFTAEETKAYLETLAKLLEEQELKAKNETNEELS